MAGAKKVVKIKISLFKSVNHAKEFLISIHTGVFLQLPAAWRLSNGVFLHETAAWQQCQLEDKLQVTHENAAPTGPRTAQVDIEFSFSHRIEFYFLFILQILGTEK